MKFNYRASLGFLIILSAGLAIIAFTAGYGFLAMTATIWAQHYFNLSELVRNLLGLGVFLVLPVTVLIGFVQD
jgi:hypothetical protein